MTQKHDYKAALEDFNDQVERGLIMLNDPAIEIIRHALTQMVETPGWRLVPDDPTEEMSMAGQVVPITESFIGDFRSAGYASDLIYRAMLDAAPKPQREE